MTLTAPAKIKWHHALRESQSQKASTVAAASRMALSRDLDQLLSGTFEDLDPQQKEEVSAAQRSCSSH